MNEIDYTPFPPSKLLELIYHEGGSTTSLRKKRTFEYQKFRELSPNHRGKSIQKGFTTKSKNNLSRTLNSINVNKLELVPLFVTTTYHDEVLKVRQENSLLKNDLHKLQKWLSYHYPNSTGFWKLENQSSRYSNNPNSDICYHFHLLIYGVDFIPNQKLNKWWNKTTGSNHKQITEVKQVRDDKDIKDYIIKRYISKDDGWYKFKDECMGRIWGTFNKKTLQDYIDPKVIEIVSNQETIEGIPIIPDQLHPDTEVLISNKGLDELHHLLKKDVIRFKDSYSRYKWNKKYNKNYHYHLIKEETGIDYDTGEILFRVIENRLREDRIHILFSNKTISNWLDFRLERKPISSIHHKINSKIK